MRKKLLSDVKFIIFGSNMFSSYVCISSSVHMTRIVKLAIES